MLAGRFRHMVHIEMLHESVAGAAPWRLGATRSRAWAQAARSAAANRGAREVSHAKGCRGLRPSLPLASQMDEASAAAARPAVLGATAPSPRLFQLRVGGDSLCAIRSYARALSPSRFSRSMILVVTFAATPATSERNGTGSFRSSMNSRRVISTLAMGTPL